MTDISDFTETEFIDLIQQILAANKANSDEELGEMLAKFRKVAAHPEGTDLIFYPEPGRDNSPEGIARTVKQWRSDRGLPGFKPE
ncbi:bacteriocin immunity protein [Pseudomonas sputi]|uniref:bacteriocin immunity protein n=1 Tax=Pseudomonas sputi TaxID=2892325 RepID=UPI001F36DB24|nr:bacteriocin immunity protein [Pseudomonas sputi]